MHYGTCPTFTPCLLVAKKPQGCSEPRASGRPRLLQRRTATLKLGARAAADEVEDARAVARGEEQYALRACAVAPRAPCLLVVALPVQPWTLLTSLEHSADEPGRSSCTLTCAAAS